MSTAQQLVEHAFRHDYGKVVAALTKRLGSRRLQIIEDATQHALMTALTAWGLGSAPDDRVAWLYTAAYRRAIDVMRRENKNVDVEQAPTQHVEAIEPPAFASEVHDDLLRMMFVCCDPTIVAESQLALALKVLCGFSSSEIALRLFTTEGNVLKRLSRARDVLRDSLTSDAPPLVDLLPRLPDVLRIVYLLFNEGYQSSNQTDVIRTELCQEAIRLAELLAHNDATSAPQTRALLALMYFHYARLQARIDELGDLVLLADQDRARWDASYIALGTEWLNKSATGDQMSKYHLLAGIAWEHCVATTFALTRWHEIAELYAMLQRIEPSPLYAMNQAIAVAEWKGPQAALDLLLALTPPAWLARYYLWDAVLADLYLRCGRNDAAAVCYHRAFAGAPTDAERKLLQRRRDSISNVR
jgi:RNA polymerase sigma factor (sigma-70 family)